MAMYVGEALAGEGNEIAHIDLLIGDKNGPVGFAFANALARQSAGHTNLLAVLTPNLAVKPATVLITKVTIQGMKYVTSRTGPGPTDSESWTFYPDGRMETHTDGEGQVTRSTYTSAGDLETETFPSGDPLARTTSFTYWPDGRVQTRTAPGEGVTAWTYGPAGPLSIQQTLSASESRTTLFTYYDTWTGLGHPGQLATVKDPDQRITTYEYLPAGDLKLVRDPLGHETTFAYDSMGRRTQATDALSHATKTTYDVVGRVKRVEAPDGTFSEFGYDAEGFRMSATDPKRKTTYSTYDGAGRLATVVDPMEGVTAYSYDAMSRLGSITDARRKQTVFEYDPNGRLSLTTFPGGRRETLTYNGRGQIETRTDRRLVTTTWSYDNAARLQTKQFSDGTPQVSYGYDAAWRLESAGNGTDTVGRAYDFAGQLKTETSTLGGSTLAYDYYAGGARATVTLNGSGYLDYFYDGDGRLQTITRGLADFGFGFDEVHRRTSLTHPNGVATSYGYDLNSRLTSLGASKLGVPVTAFGYEHDANGNRTSRSSLEFTEAYGYDRLDRLEGVTRTGTAGLWRNGYDAVGNRISAQTPDGVTGSAYNVRNELRTVSGGGTTLFRGRLNEPGTVTVAGTLATPLAGNEFEARIVTTPGTNQVQVQATDPSGNVNSTTYEFDVPAASATLDYDENGNLTSKVEGGVAWTY